MLVAATACEQSAAIDCHGMVVKSFPGFDTTCHTPADCALVVHETTCCGDFEPQAIAQASAAAFSEAEATCEAQLGPCGCPMSLDAGFIHWEIGCASGHCTLTEIPPDGGPPSP